MKSLFNTSDNKEIIDRIKNINLDNKSVWGKMNAGQMLAHCQVPLKIALGDVKQKRALIGILFGGIAKKKLVNNEPFKKNLPTSKDFIIKEQRDVEEEKKNLIEIVQRFLQTGSKGISKDPHPFFGQLTVEEWDTLMWKHLDHHLRQFGV